ncbi:MAG TPA: hypothetical protein VG738_13310 [Chitinophagaceae bacterium]|nr:hypothetical protein [Chitinophagaceae bacterium]
MELVIQSFGREFFSGPLPVASARNLNRRGTVMSNREQMTNKQPAAFV